MFSHVFQFRKTVENIFMSNISSHEFLTEVLFNLAQILKYYGENLRESLDDQLASSLLKTCTRIVFIKPEKAMRTQADIDMIVARQQAFARLIPTGYMGLCIFGYFLKSFMHGCTFYIFNAQQYNGFITLETQSWVIMGKQNHG